MNKRELEKKKEQKRKEKQKRKEQRKLEAENKTADDMIAYMDEYGNITDTPPDPTQKKEEIEIETIMISTPKEEDVEEDPILHGIVEFFNEDRGFGFIKDMKNSVKKYFFHINNAPDDITEGQEVTFDLEKGPKGMNAVNISIVRK